MVMYVFEEDWVAPGCSATPRRLHAFMTYKIDDEQKARQVVGGWPLVSSAITRRSTA